MTVLADIRRAFEAPGAGPPAGGVPREAPPATDRTQAPVDATGRLAGGLAGIAETVAEMSGGDPYTESIILGMIGRRMGVQIPTRQQHELAQMQAQIQAYERRNTLVKHQVTEAHALMLEDPDGRMRQAGVDPQGILQQPEKFVAIANDYGIPLTLGDLKRAGVGGVERTAAQRAMAMTGEQLSKSAQNLANAEKVGAAVQAAGEGEGALGEALERRETAEEQREGVTIKGFMGTDIDENAGSVAFLRLYQGFTQETGDLAGRPVAAQAFVERYGDVMRDQLEGLERNAAGELIVGKGDMGVSDAATVFLALTVQGIASDLGVSLGEAFTRLGLEYTGIDQPSLIQSLSQVTPEAFQEQVASELQGARSEK